MTIGLLTFLLTVGAVAAVGYLLTDLTLISHTAWEHSRRDVRCGGHSDGECPRHGRKPQTVLILNQPSRTSSVLFSAFLISGLEKGAVKLGIASGIGASLGVAALIGMAAGILWLQAWKMVHKFPNSTFATIAYAFVVYGFVENLEYSGAIGALTLGLTIANSRQFRAEDSPLTESERRFYGEVVFILKTFFFIYLGICMSLDQPILVLVALIAMLSVYAGHW